MEFEISYNLDNEQQFWDELDDIVHTPCGSHALIDNTLRTFLSFTCNYKAEYLNSDYDVARCSYRLLESPLFTANQDYVRLQMVHCLLQEDTSDILQLVATLLLIDGRRDEAAFEVMNKHGAFPRLLDLIPRKHREEGGAPLHRLLIELLYEMSRIQRIKSEELILVEDEFITDFFELIEELSNDVNDPYHYPVIKVLLVLNEQFMVSAHDPASAGTNTAPLTNKVIKILSAHGSAYKTFGENIILLLNRESETSLQLLTLKLLYLLFTTPSTYEYFYTNDLRVLVDILIRNLLDLPEEASALRHTYLRVLYPLLAHTQLRHPPHYKREEIRKLLRVLMRGMGEEKLLDADSPTGITTLLTHFGEVDDTTRRLVSRCNRVVWLHDGNEQHHAQNAAKNQHADRPQVTPTDEVPMPHSTEATARASSPSTSSTKPEKPPNPNPHHHGKRLVKKKPPLPVPRGSHKHSHSRSMSNPKENGKVDTLGMNLVGARESSLSVGEVAAQKEKPGVITPSRSGGGGFKAVPLPPPTRGLARRKKIMEEEERRRRRRREELEREKEMGEEQEMVDPVHVNNDGHEHDKREGLVVEVPPQMTAIVSIEEKPPDGGPTTSSTIPKPNGATCDDDDHHHHHNNQTNDPPTTANDETVDDDHELFERTATSSVPDTLTITPDTLTITAGADKISLDHDTRDITDAVGFNVGVSGTQSPFDEGEENEIEAETEGAYWDRGNSRRV